MKKQILIVAVLGLFMSFAVSAFAQEPVKKECAKTEKSCDKKEGEKKACCDKKEAKAEKACCSKEKAAAKKECCSKEAKK